MTARKPKAPALPPVLPLVAIPYVSPGQIARLKQYHMSYLEDVVLDLFAADNVAKQYEALDEMRRRLLIYIDGQPIDDPRAVPDVPVAAPAPDHVADAGIMVDKARALDELMSALGAVTHIPSGAPLRTAETVFGPLSRRTAAEYLRIRAAWARCIEVEAGKAVAAAPRDPFEALATAVGRPMTRVVDEPADVPARTGVSARAHNVRIALDELPPIPDIDDLDELLAAAASQSPVCERCHAAARDLCECGDYGGDDEGMEGHA